MRKLKDLCDSFELYMSHWTEVACEEENIITLEELIARMNDIDSLPLGKFHGQVRFNDIVDFVTQNAVDELVEFEELKVFPIHLSWDLYEEKLKRFDVSGLPQNTEIDRLELNNRIKNTLKLNGIFTIDELVKRCKDKNGEPIQYLLSDDGMKIVWCLSDEDYVDYGDFDDIPSAFSWEPKKDEKYIKIAPNAPGLEIKFIDTELNPKIRRIMEKEGIFALSDLFSKDDNGIYAHRKLNNMPGLANAGHAYLHMELNRLGYYI